MSLGAPSLEVTMTDDQTAARNSLSARLRQKFDEVLDTIAKEQNTTKDAVLLLAQQGLDRMRRERLKSN
jgi:hypothetical protein